MQFIHKLSVFIINNIIYREADYPAMIRGLRIKEIFQV